MPNTIILRGDNVTFREDRANEAITPGHLLNFAGNDRLIKQTATTGPGGSMYALEADYIGNGVAVAYASGDRVPYADCAPGTVVWAHLASGQNVARGAYLQSDGTVAGALTALTPSTNIGCAQADEDADASSGVAAGGTIRFRARVI